MIVEEDPIEALERFMQVKNRYLTSYKLIKLGYRKYYLSEYKKLSLRERKYYVNLLKLSENGTISWYSGEYCGNIDSDLRNFFSDFHDHLLHKLEKISSIFCRNVFVEKLNKFLNCMDVERRITKIEDVIYYRDSKEFYIESTNRSRTGVRTSNCWLRLKEEYFEKFLDEDYLNVLIVEELMKKNSEDPKAFPIDKIDSYIISL